MKSSLTQLIEIGLHTITAYHWAHQPSLQEGRPLVDQWPLTPIIILGRWNKVRGNLHKMVDHSISSPQPLGFLVSNGCAFSRNEMGENYLKLRYYPITWGRRAHSIGWSRINGMVSNTWFPIVLFQTLLWAVLPSAASTDCGLPAKYQLIRVSLVGKYIIHEIWHLSQHISFNGKDMYQCIDA